MPNMIISKAVPKSILPKTKIKASAINPKSLIIYSAPKIGKTTIISQLDDCLLIDLENGSDYVDAVKVKANNFAELNEICEAIKAENKPYKRVAIDTVSTLEDWCESAATDLYKSLAIGKSFGEKGETSVLQLPNGAGYNWLRIVFNQCLTSIYTLADEVILLGHLRDKALDKADSGINSGDLALVGKDKLIACARADAIGFLYRRTVGSDKGKAIQELRISFMSGTDALAGARSEHLKGQDFTFDWKKIYI